MLPNWSAYECWLLIVEYSIDAFWIECLWHICSKTPTNFGKNVRVYVLDTGVDCSNVEFAPDSVSFEHIPSSQRDVAMPSCIQRCTFCRQLAVPKQIVSTVLSLLHGCSPMQILAVVVHALMECQSTCCKPPRRFQCSSKTCTLNIIIINLLVCSWWSCGKDNDGHGSHCAGTIGGKNTGVAKLATIVAVKVVEGTATWGDVAKALE